MADTEFKINQALQAERGQTLAERVKVLEAKLEPLERKVDQAVTAGKVLFGVAGVVWALFQFWVKL